MIESLFNTMLRLERQAQTFLSLKKLTTRRPTSDYDYTQDLLENYESIQIACEQLIRMWTADQDRQLKNKN